MKIRAPPNPFADIISCVARTLLEKEKPAIQHAPLPYTATSRPTLSRPRTSGAVVAEDTMLYHAHDLVSHQSDYQQPNFTTTENSHNDHACWDGSHAINRAPRLLAIISCCYKLLRAGTSGMQSVSGPAYQTSTTRLRILAAKQRTLISPKPIGTACACARFVSTKSRTWQSFHLHVASSAHRQVRSVGVLPY